MKTRILLPTVLMGILYAQAATTIDPANPYAYGANIGWVNAAGDVANGAVIGQAFCSGYLYGANVGWIHLGDGAPVSGIAYGNGSATDYGINHDGLGNLTGYAYGANIGWVNFEQAYGKPKVNLTTGDLSGYAWGANVGWISLADVRTLSISPGPSADGDNIPDAWELGHTNTIWELNGGDADGDGMPDEAEYLADTDPFDAGDYLRIIDFMQSSSADYVTWPVKASRSYTLQRVDALSTTMVWDIAKAAFVPGADMDYTGKVSKSPTNRFYRVEAQPPLSP